MGDLDRCPACHGPLLPGLPTVGGIPRFPLPRPAPSRWTIDANVLAELDAGARGQLDQTISDAVLDLRRRELEALADHPGLPPGWTWRASISARPAGRNWVVTSTLLPVPVLEEVAGAVGVVDGERPAAVRAEGRPPAPRSAQAAPPPVRPVTPDVHDHEVGGG